MLISPSCSFAILLRNSLPNSANRVVAAAAELLRRRQEASSWRLKPPTVVRCTPVSCTTTVSRCTKLRKLTKQWNAQSCYAQMQNKAQNASAPFSPGWTMQGCSIWAQRGPLDICYFFISHFPLSPTRTKRKVFVSLIFFQPICTHLLTYAENFIIQAKIIKWDKSDW